MNYARHVLTTAWLHVQPFEVITVSQMMQKQLPCLWTYSRSSANTYHVLTSHDNFSACTLKTVQAL